MIEGSTTITEAAIIFPNLDWNRLERKATANCLFVVIDQDQCIKEIIPVTDSYRWLHTIPGATIGKYHFMQKGNKFVCAINFSLLPLDSNWNCLEEPY